MIKKRKFIVDICAFNKYYLQHLGKGRHSDFGTYLKQSIQRGIKFNAENLNSLPSKFPVHIVNNQLAVFKEYQLNGINFILKKYFRKLGPDEYRPKESRGDIFYSLIYILSENHFIIGFSDYSGYFGFYSTKSIMSKVKQED